jgi:aspartate-semialdehyde dehydrogenase
MQFSYKNKLASLITFAIALCMMASFNAVAADKKYTENEFLDAFSGKSQKVLMEALGKPFKKSQSVKPTGASSFMVGKGKEDKSKPVKVEMWYYKHNVTYDGKRTYKETEITFVNGRVMNVAFFNNR